MPGAEPLVHRHDLISSYSTGPKQQSSRCSGHCKAKRTSTGCMRLFMLEPKQEILACVNFRPLEGSKHVQKHLPMPAPAASSPRPSWPFARPGTASKTLRSAPESHAAQCQPPPAAVYASVPSPSRRASSLHAKPLGPLGPQRRCPRSATEAAVSSSEAKAKWPYIKHHWTALQEVHDLKQLAVTAETQQQWPQHIPGFLHAVGFAALEPNR